MPPGTTAAGLIPGAARGTKGGIPRPGTKCGITCERRGRGITRPAWPGASAAGRRRVTAPAIAPAPAPATAPATGSGTGYGYGYGTGSGDAYANTSSDASSTDSDSSRTDAAQETKSDGRQDGAAAERGYQAFDRARDAFKAGDYAAALDLTDEALKDVPGDPLVHEFKALALFARGEYARAAAELHAVLAVTPGMNWTTLSGLYPDVATYTGQLRALEDRCRRDPKAAAPCFVLAYHYLVAGHKDAAVAQLKAVLARSPATGWPAASSRR